MSVLGPRGTFLEEQFFGHRETELLDRLRAEHRGEVDRARLREETNIQDDALLGKLLELGVHVETIAALALVPLVEVAWADRTVDQKEADAIAEAAKKDGLSASGFDLLQSWLVRKPDETLLDAWEQYVGALRESLAPEDLTSLKNEILGHARAVAEAHGGVLGMRKVSKVEEEMLDRLARAFG